MRLLFVLIGFLFLFSLVFAQVSSSADTSFFISPETEDLRVGEDNETGKSSFWKDILIIIIALVVIFIIYSLVKRKE
jgi:hypothetical protein